MRFFAPVQYIVTGEIALDLSAKYNHTQTPIHRNKRSSSCNFEVVVVIVNASCSRYSLVRVII